MSSGLAWRVGHHAEGVGHHGAAHAGTATGTTGAATASQYRSQHHLNTAASQAAVTAGAATAVAAGAGHHAQAVAPTAAASAGAGHAGVHAAAPAAAAAAHASAHAAAPAAHTVVASGPAAAAAAARAHRKGHHPNKGHHKANHTALAPSAVAPSGIASAGGNHPGVVSRVTVHPPSGALHAAPVYPPPPPSHSGMTGGGIAALVIALLVVLGVGGFCLYKYLKDKREREHRMTVQWNSHMGRFWQDPRAVVVPPPPEDPVGFDQDFKHWVEVVGSTTRKPYPSPPTGNINKSLNRIPSGSEPVGCTANGTLVFQDTPRSTTSSGSKATIISDPVSPLMAPPGFGPPGGAPDMGPMSLGQGGSSSSPPRDGGVSRAIPLIPPPNPSGVQAPPFRSTRTGQGGIY